MSITRQEICKTNIILINLRNERSKQNRAKAKNLYFQEETIHREISQLENTGNNELNILNQNEIHFGGRDSRPPPNDPNHHFGNSMNEDNELQAQNYYNENNYNSSIRNYNQMQGYMNQNQNDSHFYRRFAPDLAFGKEKKRKFINVSDSLVEILEIIKKICPLEKNHILDNLRLNKSRKILRIEIGE